MFEKTTQCRVLTAKDLKIAVSRYIYDKYGESAIKFKFFPDVQNWVFNYPNKWPSPQMRVIELTVDPTAVRIPSGLTAEEAFGVQEG